MFICVLWTLQSRESVPSDQNFYKLVIGSQSLRYLDSKGRLIKLADSQSEDRKSQNNQP